MQAGMMQAGLILMGVVGRPHGVRGLVHVHSYTADPADLATYAPLSDDKGRRWSLAWRGEGVAELRDEAGQRVADRDGAAALTNLRLYVDRASLPVAAADEWYIADLVGLAARDAAGSELGRVVAVHDYGAGTSLEIAREGGSVLMVPFTAAAVPIVEVPSGFVVIVPPEEIAGEPEQKREGSAA